jgi:hypothetical protein
VLAKSSKAGGLDNVQPLLLAIASCRISGYPHFIRSGDNVQVGQIVLTHIQP